MFLWQRQRAMYGVDELRKINKLQTAETKKSIERNAFFFSSGILTNFIMYHWILGLNECHVGDDEENI